MAIAQAARDWSALHRGDEGIVLRPDPSTSTYAGYPGPVDRSPPDAGEDGAWRI